DAWMVRDGYGRVLSRPGLDLVRRELCVIAETAVLEAGPQMLSHWKCALNAGASMQLVAEVVTLVKQDLAESEGRLLEEMWQRAQSTEQRAQSKGQTPNSQQLVASS